jgi:hypothetical protein
MKLKSKLQFVIKNGFCRKTIVLEMQYRYEQLCIFYKEYFIVIYI